MLVRVVIGDAAGDAAYLMIGPHAFRVPDANDQNPVDWWVIEAVTGIAAERIARAWKKDNNRPLADASALVMAEVDNWPDSVCATKDGLRRAIVRQRLERGLYPNLFAGRPELIVLRIRLLLEDVYGGILFTAVDTKHIVPAIVRHIEGRAEILRITRRAQANGLVLRGIRMSKPGKVPKGVDPSTIRVPPQGGAVPPTILDDLIEFPPEWPRIHGVNRLPTIRADGSISDFIGYDPLSRVWFEPEPSLRNIHVPDAPTLDDVARAAAALIQPIAEFPFVDGYASAIAILIERLAMPLLTGPRPVYVIDAPEHGQSSGKSTLARAMAAIVLGHDPPMTSWATTETEREKLLGSMLRAGDEIGWFDNLTEKLDSDSITRLATSTVWKSRTLGVSESPAFPNLITPIFTLNNARCSEDMLRRVILVRLDKRRRTARQQQGQFDIGDVVSWVIHYRAHLIQAALTIIKSWTLAGYPIDVRLAGKRGGFERWLHVVGGVLAHGGIDGLPQSLDAVAERHEHVDDDADLLDAWQRAYGHGAVTTGDLVRIALGNGLYMGLDLRGKDGSWPERVFVREVLSRLTGTDVERLSEKPATWRLVYPDVVPTVSAESPSYPTQYDGTIPEDIPHE